MTPTLDQWIAEVHKCGVAINATTEAVIGRFNTNDEQVAALDARLDTLEERVAAQHAEHHHAQDPLPAALTN